MTNLEGYPTFVERTLFALSEPFLVDEKASESPLATGHYRFTGSYMDKEVSGTIGLEKERVGEMTMPEALHSFLAQNGQPAPDAMKIVDVVRTAEGVEMLVAIPYGIIEVPCRVTKEGFEGTMTLSQSSLEFSAIRE